MPRRPADDDEDDRPRRRRPAPEPSGGGSRAVLWVTLGLAGVVGLAAVGGAAWWFVGRKPPAAGNPPVVAGGPPAKTDPAVPAKKDEPPELKPKHKIKTGFREIFKVHVSADGGRVVAYGNGPGDKALTEVWDLRPEPTKVREFPKHARGLSADGKLTALGRDGGSDVVEIDTGRVVSSPRVYLLGRNVFAGPWVIGSELREAPVGSKTRPTVVSRFDARTGQPAGEIVLPGEGYTNRLVPIGDGKELLAGRDRPLRVEVWSFETGQKVRGGPVAGAPPAAGWSNFAVSPDGKLVTAEWSSIVPVKLIDTATGKETGTVTDGTGREGGNPASVVFVPGRQLVVGGGSWSSGNIRDKTFQSRSGYQAYDPVKPRIVANLPGAWLDPAISADGTVMVSLTDRTDPTLLVWDLTAIP